MKKILSAFVLLYFATAISVQVQDISKVHENLTPACGTFYAEKDSFISANHVAEFSVSCVCTSK